jgi:hypothetical protein
VKRILPALAAILVALSVPLTAFAADTSKTGQTAEGLGKEHVTQFMFITILVLIGVLALVGIWESHKSKRK